MLNLSRLLKLFVWFICMKKNIFQYILLQTRKQLTVQAVRRCARRPFRRIMWRNGWILHNFTIISFVSLYSSSVVVWEKILTDWICKNIESYPICCGEKIRMNFNIEYYIDNRYVNHICQYSCKLIMKISIKMEINYTQAFTILHEQYKLLYIQIFDLFFHNVFYIQYLSKLTLTTKLCFLC